MTNRRSIPILSSNHPEKYPVCPGCKRSCTPLATWVGANYCRGRILLPVIARQPGLSGWELAEASGLCYGDATKALAKLREYELVITKAEPRPQGGFRYRYWLGTDQDAFEHFLGRRCNDGS
jgi:hypothetical protein